MGRKFTLFFSQNVVGSLEIRASRKVYSIFKNTLCLTPFRGAQQNRILSTRIFNSIFYHKITKISDSMTQTDVSRFRVPR